MQSKFLRPLIPGLFSLVIIFWGCTKVDTTTIGSDLIPAVDNVHTFEETFDINTTQGLFIDSTRMGVSDNYVLGTINNDPVFGKTNGNIFLQLKPPFFPFSFGPKDSLAAPLAGLDSVVLSLSYKGFYGDTNLPQHIRVYQLNNNTSFKDSAYKINFTPDKPFGNFLGETDVDVRSLRQYRYLKNGDSINNQIRIKLDPQFALLLWNRDSLAGSANNAFSRDSIYNEFYRGFAIVADENNNNANGLMYISLSDTKTRLEIHYRKKIFGRIDTTYAIFPFAYSGSTVSTSPQSAHANNVTRDRSGSEFGTQADALYLQTAPGSYATLEIPKLDTLSNRIVHRAEIIAEQIPGDMNFDGLFTNPGYLYLDLRDNATGEKYKPLYYDLNPNVSYDPDNASNFFPSSGIDFSSFGGFARYKTDPITGRSIAYYTFNLSRYVQNMVTKKTPNYKLRLYAPYQLFYNGLALNYNNSLAFGRIKIGSGANANYKLRMRIVYSNL